MPNKHELVENFASQLSEKPTENLVLNFRPQKCLQ